MYYFLLLIPVPCISGLDDKVDFDPKNMDHIELYLDNHTPKENNSLSYLSFKGLKCIYFDVLQIRMYLF